MPTASHHALPYRDGCVVFHPGYIEILGDYRIEQPDPHSLRFYPRESSPAQGSR